MTGSAAALRVGLVVGSAEMDGHDVVDLVCADEAARPFDLALMAVTS